MNTPDGKRMVPVPGSKPEMYNVCTATRWEELGDTVNNIGHIGAQLGRTQFHLLNGGGACPQYMVVGGEAADDSDYMSGLVRGNESDLRTMTASRAYGGTPLTEHVQHISSIITPHAQQLRAQGQSVVVVLATDGCPNNPQSFKEAVKMLQQLPVWLVVRLCTDDEKVVAYWNDLDAELELPMEVLDDPEGEAEEVHECNPWLTYGLPLHQAREFGLRDQIFDLLDERLLTHTEMRLFVKRLFDCDLPDPQADWASFERSLTEVLADEPMCFDPRTKKAKPWINMKQLSKSYNPRHSMFSMKFWR